MRRGRKGMGRGRGKRGPPRRGRLAHPVSASDGGRAGPQGDVRGHHAGSRRLGPPRMAGGTVVLPKRGPHLPGRDGHRARRDRQRREQPPVTTWTAAPSRTGQTAGGQSHAAWLARGTHTESGCWPAGRADSRALAAEGKAAAGRQAGRGAGARGRGEGLRWRARAHGTGDGRGTLHAELTSPYEPVPPHELSKKEQSPAAWPPALRASHAPGDGRRLLSRPDREEDAPGSSAQALSWLCPGAGTSAPQQEARESRAMGPRGAGPRGTPCAPWAVIGSNAESETRLPVRPPAPSRRESVRCDWSTKRPPCPSGRPRRVSTAGGGGRTIHLLLPRAKSRWDGLPLSLMGQERIRELSAAAGVRVGVQGFPARHLGD